MLIKSGKNKNVNPKIKVYTNSQVINAYGNLKLQSIDVVNSDGKIINIECDFLGVSGGWNPNIHISCHTGVKPEWNNKILALDSRFISERVKQLKDWNIEFYQGHILLLLGLLKFLDLYLK